MAHEFTIPGTLGPRIDVRRTLIGTIKVVADGQPLKRQGRLRASYYEVRATDGETYRFHISGGLGALKVHVEGVRHQGIALERELEWWEWILILAAYPILYFVLDAGLAASAFWGSIAAAIAARFARSTFAAPIRLVGLIVASGLTMALALAVSVGIALLVSPVPEFDVGSCLDGVTTATEISNETIDTVPCSDTHDGEVFAHVIYPGDRYPGVETLQAYALEACQPLFEEYVGLPYGESTLPMVPFVPRDFGWLIGRRTIDCVAYTPQSLVEYGSVKGTGRLTAMLPAGLVSVADRTFVMADATLDRDLAGTVRITQDGVTLDCDGHSVIGSGAGAGIVVEDRRDVTVRNCQVSGFEQGIDVLRSTATTIEDNVARGSLIGLRLLESNGNTLARNQATDSGDIGIKLVASTGNELIENVTDGSVREGFKIEGGSADNRLRDNAVSGARRGAAYWIYGSTGNELIGNVAKDNATQGFVVAGGSMDAVLADNQALDNEANGYIVDSANARVEGNHAENNGGDGFIVRGSAGSDVVDNTTRYNRGLGIRYDGSPRSTFEGNICLLDIEGLSQPFGICDPPLGSTTVGLIDITADTTLHTDHRGPIQFGASGVTLDCDGHSIIGVDDGPAIHVIDRSGVSVKNCHIAHWNDAIRVEGTRDSRFLNNRADDVKQGFTLRNADGNELLGNVITGADGWFAYLLLEGSDGNQLDGNVAQRGLAGFVIQDSSANTLAGNLAIDTGGTGFAVSGPGARDNAVTDNLALGALGGGFDLPRLSGTTYAGNICSHTVAGGQIVACAVERDVQRPDIGEFTAAALVAAGETEPPGTVPELVGLDAEAAAAELQAAGLRGIVRQMASDDVPAGVVISQGIAPGTELGVVRTIAYAVSTGPGSAQEPQAGALPSP